MIWGGFSYVSKTIILLVCSFIEYPLNFSFCLLACSSLFTWEFIFPLCKLLFYPWDDSLFSVWDFIIFSCDLWDMFSSLWRFFFLVKIFIFHYTDHRSIQIWVWDSQSDFFFITCIKKRLISSSFVNFLWNLNVFFVFINYCYNWPSFWFDVCC